MSIYWYFYHARNKAPTGTRKANRVMPMNKNPKSRDNGTKEGRHKKREVETSRQAATPYSKRYNKNGSRIAANKLTLSEE